MKKNLLLASTITVLMVTPVLSAFAAADPSLVVKNGLKKTTLLFKCNDLQQNVPAPSGDGYAQYSIAFSSLNTGKDDNKQACIFYTQIKKLQALIGFTVFNIAKDNKSATVAQSRTFNNNYLFTVSPAVHNKDSSVTVTVEKAKSTK